MKAIHGGSTGNSSKQTSKKIEDDLTFFNKQTTEVILVKLFFILSLNQS